MTKIIEFLKTNIKTSALLGGLFSLCCYLVSELYLQPLCNSDQQKWYCFFADPTISEQLAELENSKQAAPWKVKLNHIKINNQVKIVPQIELTDKAYLSLFKINVSSDAIIIKANSYLIDASSNKKFDLAWSVDLAAGKNILKLIITSHPIDWETILSNKKVELIESLQKHAKFWTADSLIIYNR
jgi:hypothetical protein